MNAVPLGYFELMRWGDQGWADEMAFGVLVTLAVSVSALAIGLVIGTLGAWAKIAGAAPLRAAADAYTTVLRGFPDLLVIYLFYFGGSAAVTAVARQFGATGFVGAPAFLVGAMAVGVISGAYQTEVLRGAVLAVPRGEIEAGRAFGMSRWLLFRRVVAPQALRYALPGMGNVWQLVLKESALISVTGLTELLRTAHVGAGSTKQPFSFYITAAALYLLLTTLSGQVFARAERRALRGLRRA
jgi:octopine/nopaline transport system permease protein